MNSNTNTNINAGKKKNGIIRHFVQAAFFALTNGYAKGFMEGKIYTGSTKALCFPGLNCYSCPGALLSCPIGSLQAVLGGRGYRVSLYVFGILAAIGSFCGRFVCGWLCPFGMVQDLMYKIPVFKKVKNLPGHKLLRYLKYAVLAVLVLLLPALVRDATGLGEPWFCEYVCPSGTLLAGIPLISLNTRLQSILGIRFTWKLDVLLIILVLSVKSYRPFCKYLCPLGALYGFFNPIAIYRLKVDGDKCIKCGACVNKCKMGVDVMNNPNSFECIRCGDCRSICPKGAITTTFEKTIEKAPVNRN